MFTLGTKAGLGAANLPQAEILGLPRSVHPHECDISVQRNPKNYSGGGEGSQRLTGGRVCPSPGVGAVGDSGAPGEGPLSDFEKWSHSPCLAITNGAWSGAASKAHTSAVRPGVAQKAPPPPTPPKQTCPVGIH